MNIINRTNYPLIFDDFINDFLKENHMSIPPHNIKETENDFQIEFSVPGSNKKDFEIEIDSDNLKITKKKDESNSINSYSRQEFNYDFFEKSFFLPDSIDQNRVTSKYDNGILKIVLPKKSEVIIKNKKKFINVK